MADPVSDSNLERDPEISQKRCKKALWREFQAACSVLLCIVITGMDMGFSAVAIPDIQLQANTKENSTVPVIPITPSISELSRFGKY